MSQGQSLRRVNLKPWIAPDPVPSVGAKPGCDWVLDYISDGRVQVLLRTDDPRGKALLEQVSTPCVTLVETLRVYTVQAMHGE
jgi:hypothetical protein